MLAFSLLAAAVCAVCAALVMMRAAGAERAAGEEDPALRLHRRQLTEIDELSERGLMPEGEVRAVKAEAARRLLGAAALSPADTLTGGRGVVLAAIVGAVLLALGLHFLIGSPGVPDQPFAARVKQWQADPVGLTPAEMAAAIAASPADKRGTLAYYRALSLARFAAGQTAQAEQAARQAIDLSPNDAGLWSLLGRTRLTEDETVPPAARAAFQQALSLNANDRFARYYLGLDEIQRGRAASGLLHWKTLLATLPPGEAAASLASDIKTVEQTGRLPNRVEQETAAAGVDVRAMIAGLAAKLKASPNDPDGWVKLVRAYAVLDDVAGRDGALNEARRIFAGRQDVLQSLNEAAAPPK